MAQIDEFFLENKPLFSGKIRDIYDYGDDRLLIRTSDKISAFDFVFDDEILNKGSLLTNITKIWLIRIDQYHNTFSKFLTASCEPNLFTKLFVLIQFGISRG